MSITVDSKVVEMQFDNRQFERNVSTTMSTLEKFKQALKLDGATKGLDTVSTSAKRIDLSGLTGAAETVGLKFNAMYTIADQALRNIVNSAMSAGKRIISALTIEPIKTGLQEYETQINAVQTILANTESKGTTLKDVNSALDTLNTYADKTIYNFTEMTRNIGTFTAAGVDLDTSVNAIQGIANLAAVSGSTSQQASTAMYQLSQAMASGTVKLMDWNSVVNAGMGGQVFQDALKETARVHGINVDAMIKKHGSFRETLQEGWITTDILTETLSHFTMAAQEGSEQWNEYKKSLMDSGYSEEQANAILKMSNTATDAATKVKTATQLFDTLKETAQSGWTQTWEIIMGDFEEAKNLFSMLYETLSPILEASAKARNDILEGWAEAGGRNDMIESLQNVFKAIGSIVKPIKEAFTDIFPASLDDKINSLVNFTKGLKEFTAKLTLSDKVSENLRRTFKGLFAILDIVKQAFSAVFVAISPLFGKIDDLGGGILETTAKWGDWLVGLNESIKQSGFFTLAIEKINKAFAKVKAFLKPVIESIRQFADGLANNLTAAISNAETRLGPLSKLGLFLKNVFVGIWKVIKKVFPYVASVASAIGTVIHELMDRISDSIQNANYDGLFDMFSSGTIAAIGVFIAKFMKSGADILDGAGGFMENINNILEGVGDALGAFTDSLKAETLKKIATAIGILAVSLLVLSLIPSDKLATALLSITTLFGELMGSMAIFSKLGNMKGITKTAGALVGLASAMLILSIALKIMSTMSWSEMGVGLISMTVGLGELVGAVYLLSIMPEKKLNGSVNAIKGLAGALIVLAVALKIMGSMSWEEMGMALISMTAALGAMIGVVWALPSEKELKSASKAIASLAASLVVMALALKIMASMSWEEMARGLITMVLALGAMIGVVWALPKDIGGKAAGILVLASALVVLAGALKIMGSMSFTEMAIGLGSMIIALGAMIGLMWALPKDIAVKAAGILVLSAALLVLAIALKAMGGMSWEEVIRGLVTLAGAFVIIGVAGLLLAPIVPSILALAGSVALLGIGILAAGVGVLAFAAGLTALAAALAVSGGAITTFVASIISLIPFLIEQIGLGIIKLCEVIAGSADAICSAISTIIIAVVDALVASVPSLVEGLLVLIESLLESLVNHLPTIVSLLTELTVKLLGALAEHVPTITEALFSFMVVIIDSLAANIGVLLEPMLNLLGIIFQGIADVIGPVVETVIAPLLGVLSDLIVGLVEAIAPYIPEIRMMVQTICDAFVFLFAQLVPIIQSITDLVRQLGESISLILDSIANVIVSVGVVIGIALQGLADVFDSIAGAIEKTLTGLSEVFDSVFNGISEVVTSVGESIRNVLDGIAGIIESIGEAALNAGTGFENLAKGVKIITDLKLADMAASLTAVATGIGKIAKHADEMDEIGTGMKNLGKSLMTSMVEGIDSQIVKLTKAAEEAVKKFAAAIEAQEKTATKSWTNLIKACTKTVSKAEKEFGSAGKNLVRGFANGISANTYLAKAKAKAMAAAAADAAKKELDEHSPSKVGYGIGDFFGIAFVNGIADNIKNAYTVSTNLAKSARDGMNNAISKISAAIDTDIDTQPTIRPVLDLSDVRSGASAISGMLDVNSSVGVRANLGAISSMMSTRSQNGVNDDVVSAIDKLSKKMDNMGNTTYHIDGVTYDDGSNITDAVRTIVRAARIERRV